MEKVKVRAYVYSPDMPKSSADFTLIAHRYWNSIFQYHLLGEIAVHFLELNQFTQYQIFFRLIPITAGWTETVWTHELTQGFYARPAPWESNPRPLDLGSNALTTTPHAPQDVEGLSVACQDLVLINQ